MIQEQNIIPTDWAKTNEYYVRITTERITKIKVLAKNKKDAIKKAREWRNHISDHMIKEKIISIDKVYDREKCKKK